ncbi:type II toxin-antitoxin system HicA family toxin [uncultured Dokdonia sp.]|uniref:type II toxin-antitoxin system HicA family toxin n=1 Tax=uncultured Dokdonia sp. TaxID=575653 RepID=UPI0026188A67|nr:type II toxin-antitoxin system HicA family toxin [uncultured Dokdonia sp.]
MAKVSELLRRLKKDGWHIHRHGKKHDLYRHPEKNGELVIPRHGSKELAKGTLHSILKEAGL